MMFSFVEIQNQHTPEKNPSTFNSLTWIQDPTLLLFLVVLDDQRQVALNKAALFTLILIG